MPTVEEIKAALSTVNDPDLNKDLVTLGMIKNIQVDGGAVSVTVELTTPACPLKAKIQQDCEQAINRVEGVEKLTVEMTARTRGSKTGEEEEDLLPGVKNVILVASGKGAWASPRWPSTWRPAWHSVGRPPACWTRTSTAPPSPP